MTPENQALVNWILSFGVIVSMGANIAIIIGVFRRRPTIEAEFVTKADCHRQMKTDAELQSEFVTRREWEITELERRSLRDDIKKLLQTVTAIAVKQGIEIEA
jgi:hypothetical protein